MKTLREQLGKPVLFHRVGWHGKDGLALSATGYDSRDPGVITRQLDAIEDWGGEGCGVAALSYGLTSPFIIESCMAACNQCNARKMPFVLVFDPWAVKDPKTGQLYPSPMREDMYIATLLNPEHQFMLNSPSYLPGKPVMDFATGVNVATVKASVPGIQFWLKGTDYDWPQIPSQPNKTKLPCVFVEFNDGTGPDRNKSVWDQAQPVRIVPSLAGRTFWRDCSGAQDWIQLVSLDDVAEGTDVEKFGAIVAGRI